MDRHEIFNEVIIELHSWNDKYVAEQAGLSPVTLWNWKHGSTVSPRFNNLMRVAEVIGFDITVKKVRKFRRVS